MRLIDFVSLNSRLGSNKEEKEIINEMGNNLGMNSWDRRIRKRNYELDRKLVRQRTWLSQVLWISRGRTNNKDRRLLDGTINQT